MNLCSAVCCWQVPHSRNRPAKRQALTLPLGSARLLPISSRKLLVREKFLMSRLLEDWLDLLASYERPLCQ
jgi:hypothetical protein